MNILETIVRLPFVFLPGKLVRHLRIVPRGVEGLRRLQTRVMNILIFGQQFRAPSCPRHVPSCNPFAEVYSGPRAELIVIIGAPQLQPRHVERLSRQFGEPRTVVVDIAAVTCLAEVRIAAVAKHQAIAQAQAT